MVAFPDALKDHPVATFFGGIALGLAIYQGIIKLADLEVVPRRSSCPAGQVGLRVEAYPSDASIAVADLGKAFTQGVCVPEGRHRLTLSAPGYQHEIQTIHLGKSDYIAVVELRRIIPVILEGSASKKYTGEPLSLNMQNVKLGAVIQVIREFTGANIITAADVDQLIPITIGLKDVPWDEALDRILEINGFALRRTKSVITVYVPHQQDQPDSGAKR